jgi:hypothetical protein
MKALESRLSIRLQEREAQRLENLANAHGLSTAELVRTLVKWLPSETVTQVIDRSRGYTGGN